jgi:DNA adenine methylase
MSKPFLKWAGGKSQSLAFLQYHMCERTVLGGITNTIEGRFIEPFVGSGVVFMNMNAGEYVINDINTDLVLIYKALQANGEEFIEMCEELFIPENNHQEKYNSLREEFNNTDTKDIRRGALFVYLNRHGFNGLCRYNKSGGFNVPFGKYDSVSFPKENLTKAIDKLKGVIIFNRSFEEIMAMTVPGDVCYLDPPYVPMSSTASFTDYATTGFTYEDQKILARAAEESEAKIFISNHDNEVTRELYKNATEIITTEVTRFISADASSRGTVRELLAIYR